MSYALTALADESHVSGSDGFILNDIDPCFDLELMLGKIKPGSANVERIYRELIEEARSLARPQAVFKTCSAEAWSHSKVRLNGVPFNSKLLRINLSGLDQAFAYVATEGPEMAGWAESLSGARKAFAWPIRYAALKLAEKHLVEFIRTTFGLRQISSMNPGSLALWPIEEQRPLFELLDPLPSLAGVVLGSGFWMSPDLSSSGVLFETEVKFYNCQLCPLDHCEHRRTEYRGRAGWPEARTIARGVQ